MVNYILVLPDMKLLSSLFLLGLLASPLLLGTVRAEEDELEEEEEGEVEVEELGGESPDRPRGRRGEAWIHAEKCTKTAEAMPARRRRRRGG